MSEQTRSATSNNTKYLIVAVLAVAVFFASYGFAQARNGKSAADAANGSGYTIPASYGVASDDSVGACGGGCCGTDSGEEIEGATVVEGDSQSIYVEIPGGYSPNVIRAKAGIPLSITFAQSDGCTAEVIIPEFNLYADLTGGEQTLTLPALDPGTYGFSCGMEMVFGSIVVE
ncbi:MAG: cupredoxin domain-containing protein [Actinomycetota bacterium]|jgi:hypothetical protein|nr:cupredoxin domain-containing protein [Actinomycetota bacterium]